jgi:hypothetical protein
MDINLWGPFDFALFLHHGHFSLGRSHNYLSPKTRLLKPNVAIT